MEETLKKKGRDETEERTVAKKKRARCATDGEGKSIANNLRAIRDNKYGCEEAKFYLSRLRDLTGMTEQKILVELILSGMDSSGFTKGYRDTLKKEWEARTR